MLAPGQTLFNRLRLILRTSSRSRVISARLRQRWSSSRFRTLRALTSLDPRVASFLRLNREPAHERGLLRDTLVLRNGSVAGSPDQPEKIVGENQVRVGFRQPQRADFRKFHSGVEPRSVGAKQDFSGSRTLDGLLQDVEATNARCVRVDI